MTWQLARSLIQEGQQRRYGRKFAVTDLAALIVTVHWFPLTESHPVHPLKMERISGVAVSVTTAPRLYIAEHVDPQLIPPGLDVTVPVPIPRGPLALLTVSLAVTVKLPALVPEPPGVVTLTSPLVAVVGTVA